MRRFGRTNRDVSIVGFGGTWIAQLSTADACTVVRRAVDLGINYFDTARWDGDSEEKLGIALEGCNNKCIIATKTGSRTKRESLNELKQSLENLRANKLDVIQLHGIDDEKTLKKAMGTNGSLQTCKEARQKGLVESIGITGHRPRILAKALRTEEFDTVMVPLNVVTRQALEELIPLAKDLDVGIAAMKPYSAKTSNLITCLYQPSLSLLSDEPELEALLGENNETMVRSALSYILKQEVAVVVPGYSSIREVEVAAKVGRDYTGLSIEEEQRFAVNLDNYCTDCGECQPCPQGLNIPAILRFKLFAERFRLEKWAKKLYAGLNTDTDRCVKCLECERKCPNHLGIVAELQTAKEKFS